jgi:DNA-binding NtrC family response regulator
MLLITNDDGLEDLAAQALSEIGGVSHLTRDPGDALEAVCGAEDFDVVLIDIDQGHHLITLLNAIKTCRQDLHVIAIARDDDKHFKALAYANGAAACFPKPISAGATGHCNLQITALEPRTGCRVRRRIDNAKDESQRFSRTE